jgi:signal recognition particle subunit SRP19
MSNPRIEEVSDDEDVAADPEEMDPDTFDFARPQKGSLQPSLDPDTSQIKPEELASILQPQTQNQQASRQQPQMSDKDRERLAREQKERSKSYQCIYPVYFDSTRSREEGRRVKKEDAVTNPLAREIVDALQHIGQTVGVGLQIVFEPSKCHPKDWANPGRVKVLVKKEGRAVSAKIANSMISPLLCLVLV